MKIIRADWINYHEVVELLGKEHSKYLTKEETRLLGNIRKKLRELKKTKSLKHIETLQKSSKPKNFIELYLEGKIEINQIDEYIEKWHLSKEDTPIYEYLGMRKKEYVLWVTNSEKFTQLVKSKKILLNNDKREE